MGGEEVKRWVCARGLCMRLASCSLHSWAAGRASPIRNPANIPINIDTPVSCSPRNRRFLNSL